MKPKTKKNPRGAGREKVGNIRTQVTLQLSPEVSEKLEYVVKYCETNKAALIKDALLNYLKQF